MAAEVSGEAARRGGVVGCRALLRQMFPSKPASVVNFGAQFLQTRTYLRTADCESGAQPEPRYRRTSRGALPNVCQSSRFRPTQLGTPGRRRPLGTAVRIPPFDR